MTSLACASTTRVESLDGTHDTSENAPGADDAGSATRDAAGTRDDATTSNPPSSPTKDDSGAAPIDAGPPKRVFVSSAKYGGNLGGGTGADAKCQAAADAAGLGGTFAAFVATEGEDPIDRVGSGPWYSADRSTLLFTGTTTGSYPLAGPAPAASIALDENLQPFDYATYWTGAQVGGAWSAFNCGFFKSFNPDWGGERGVGGTSVSGAGGAWIRYLPGLPAKCNEENHLLCFEK